MRFLLNCLLPNHLTLLTTLRSTALNTKLNALLRLSGVIEIFFKKFQARIKPFPSSAI